MQPKQGLKKGLWILCFYFFSIFLFLLLKLSKFGSLFAKAILLFPSRFYIFHTWYIYVYICAKKPPTYQRLLNKKKSFELPPSPLSLFSKNNSSRFLLACFCFCLGVVGWCCIAKGPKDRARVLGNVTMVVDGYSSPVTAGNFIDLALR